MDAPCALRCKLSDRVEFATATWKSAAPGATTPAQEKCLLLLDRLDDADV